MSPGLHAYPHGRLCASSCKASVASLGGLQGFCKAPCLFESHQLIPHAVGRTHPVSYFEFAPIRHFIHSVLPPYRVPPMLVVLVVMGMPPVALVVVLVLVRMVECTLRATGV